MANLFNIRRWKRDDQPQPIYTGSLNLWEAYRYVPIGTAQRETRRTSERRSDRTYLQQTVPAFSWVWRIVETTVSTWTPVFDAQDSYRVVGRRPLDVRSFDSSPQNGWLYTAANPSAATTAQLWPAILLGLNPNYRSVERARLDVRRPEWAPENGWIGTVADGVIRTWASIFATELGNRRTPERSPLIDVRRPEWAPENGWLFPVVAATIAAWAPIWQAELGYRVAGRRLLDVRSFDSSPEPAWIFSVVPVTATVAQLWPAILLGLNPNYRSAERQRIDVRRPEWSPEFGWVFKVVDGTVAKWAPVWRAELGYRSEARRSTDVRMSSMMPEQAWFTAVITFYLPFWAVNPNTTITPGDFQG